jgi:hypothetical protein
LSRFKTLAGGLEIFKEAIKLFWRRKKKAAAGGNLCKSGDDDGEDSE